MLSKRFGFIVLMVCCVWVISGQFVRAQDVQPLRSPVYEIAVSGDHRVLAVTYSDFDYPSRVDFFSNETGELISTADLSPYFPNLIALSPTGDRLTWTDNTARLGVYDTFTRMNTLLHGEGQVSYNDISWNPVNDTIAYALGGILMFWDASSGEQMGFVNAGSPSVVSFAWSPDGEQLVTSHATYFSSDSDDDRVNTRLWEDALPAPSELINTPVLTLEGRGGGRVAWSPDGARFVVVESEGMLIYDIASETVETILIDEMSLSMAVWSPDGNFLATGGAIIRIWDTTTWDVVTTITPEPGGAHTLQWSFDGQQIFYGGGRNGLYVAVVEFSE